MEAESEALMWKGKAKASFESYRTVLLQVRKKKVTVCLTPLGDTVLIAPQRYV